MTNGAWLYHAGIALVAAGILVGVVAFVVLFVKKKRLNTQLEREYGPKK